MHTGAKMSNENLTVGEDGTVQRTPILTDLQRNSRMREIIEQIKDPNAPLAPIKRMIAEEIAVASEQIISFSGDLTSMESLNVKALESLVKTLRELGKELMESDVLSKKDFLNFDGVKLRFVLEEYMKGAKDTLEKVGIDSSTIQQFVRGWRDLMLERESGIRKAADSLTLDDKQ